MAITINGTGSITGLTAGGLPDGSVTAADIETSLDLTGKTVTLPSGTGGKFASYAVIADQKTANTDGGSGTSNTWVRRDLNTELFDADGIVSISSNQFTLAAGSYLIKCSAPSYRANYHQIRLYDSTGSAVVQTGTSEWSWNSNDPIPQTRSFLCARVTPSASNTYEIQHIVQTAYSGEDFGRGNNFGTETYTIVEIYKEA